MAPPIYLLVGFVATNVIGVVGANKRFMAVYSGSEGNNFTTVVLGIFVAKCFCSCFAGPSHDSSILDWAGVTKDIPPGYYGLFDMGTFSRCHI